MRRPPPARTPRATSALRETPGRNAANRRARIRAMRAVPGAGLREANRRQAGRDRRRRADCSMRSNSRVSSFEHLDGILEAQGVAQPLSGPEEAGFDAAFADAEASREFAAAPGLGVFEQQDFRVAFLESQECIAHLF